MKKQKIIVIGGGLAGCEAAWQIAKRNIKVKICEMRPKKQTNAHQTDKLAELVCSNSFRSDDQKTNAVGLLHQEMRMAESLIMKIADKNKIPAGSALAVDREEFANDITKEIENQKNIEIVREEITEITNDTDTQTIIATGPLTANKLAQEINKITQSDALAFFDAIAPIVHFDSINMKKAWFQSRYDKGEGKDYINCPMNEEEYKKFVSEIIKAEKTEFKEWEQNTPYFEGCLPIEIMAERGNETLRYGPMKPIGLTNQHKPNEKAYAVVQLRQDNKIGTLYNIVGFQTKLKYNEQKKIFKMIPGLENAEFARLGGIHRNSYINSPEVLNENLEVKNCPNVKFAGQITGCEGYVESAAVGMLVGINSANKINGKKYMMPPNTTALGALVNHITNGHVQYNDKTRKRSFQPMNINFGLFQPPTKNEMKNIKPKNGKWKGKEKNKAKKEFITQRAIKDTEKWIKEIM